MAGQQRAWIKWLHLGEYCYNTSFHMSIGMSPFRALYNYDALTFVDLVFGDSRAPGLGTEYKRARTSLKLSRTIYKQQKTNKK